MPRIIDYLVQEYDAEEFSRETLHRPLFDVNMRLFRSSPFYRQLVMDTINYMDAHLNMTFEDYPAPRGVSGANLGIPWNIIGFKHQNKNKFCINPRILNRSTEGVVTETNCGSFRLEKAVKVFRSDYIDLEYYDLKGQRIIEKNIGRYQAGFVIQHEVDHNCGVCITDKIVKEQSVVQEPMEQLDREVPISPV